MTKEYKQLFSLVANNNILNCESLLKEGLDEKTSSSVSQMLKNFRKIYAAIDNNEELVQADYVMLYAGAAICSKMLEKNRDLLSQTIEEYKTNLLPKLEQVGEAKTEQECAALVEKYFS